MQASSFLMGPHQTPNSVKRLIWATCVFSLLSPVLTFLCAHYLQMPGPGAWFSLSLAGLQRGWLWQPLTYFFLHSAGVGITFSLLITLFFHMLLLWFSGSELVLRFGSKMFFLFYFTSGIISGIISAAMLYIFSSPSIIVGTGPPIFALLMVWAMLFPELELFFLLFVRIKAKWLVAIVLGISLLVNLSVGSYIPFCANLTGIIWGFLFGRLVWKLPNPYPLNLEFFPKKRKKREGKIIDITAFQETDEAFMDRMLEKIAREGEDALTSREKERMRKISESQRD